MDRIEIDKISDDISYLFAEREVSNLYMMNNREILKVFDMDFLSKMSSAGFDIEKKVLNSEKFINDGVIAPCSAVYYNKKFIGYTMPFFNGICIFDAYDSGYFNNSLYKYADFFSRLEKIVLDNDKIVFTDLLSAGNIMVNANDNIKIIDFDDLQIGDYMTSTISSGLGDRSLYWNTKYMFDGMYTKELDVKSLIYLYFNFVFNIDLSRVDYYYIDSYKGLLLDQIFNDTCIDNDLIDKVSRIYDNSVNNLYLGDTLFNIAEKYVIEDFMSERGFIKRLRIK